MEEKANSSSIFPLPSSLARVYIVACPACPPVMTGRSGKAKPAVEARSFKVPVMMSTERSEPVMPVTGVEYSAALSTRNSPTFSRLPTSASSAEPSAGEMSMRSCKVRVPSPNFPAMVCTTSSMVPS